MSKMQTYKVTAKDKSTGYIKVHMTGLSKYAAKQLKNTLKLNHPEYHVFSECD